MSAANTVNVGPVPLARPSTPDPAAIADRVEAILRSGVLTNGPTVRELEERVAGRLGVRHCLAVSSCTTGLMLVLRSADLRGEVIVPSFTFSATAHAVAWNGLRPVFADCDPETLTLSPAGVDRVAGPRAAAILATHVFGTPCDVDGLQELASRLGLRLFFDAAHAFGSLSGGRPVGGFGDAEVFSLTPTKPLVAGEGGLITTNDDELAERCRMGRDYGNPGDYDCRFVGLNARMSELHAAVALASLESIDERLERRNALQTRYAERLEPVDGISFPVVRPGDRSTFKDLTVLLPASADRARLIEELDAAGIETRTYYHPPVHRQQAYTGNGWGSPPPLPVTEEVCRRVLTLPLWEEMTEAQVDGVCGRIRVFFDAVQRERGA
jgi:dTDP-4-amino-4,6-dideoxygalactose transaminase